MTAEPRQQDDFMDMPGHLIRRLHQRSVAIFAEEMSEAGLRLTPVQYAALSTLRREPGLDQARLAATIAYDRATIGGVVDRLTGRGLIRREISETDRRARVLHLTPEGEAMLRDAAPLVQKVQARTLGALPEEDAARLTALLIQALGQEE